MKSLFAILAIALFQFSVSAQNSSDAKEEMAVASRVETLRQAMIDADGNNLSALSSADLSYGHSDGHIQNKAEFIEKIVSKKSVFVSTEFQNQTIEIIGDVALVRHTLVAHTKDGGIEKDIKIGVLLVWQKQKKQWMLIARQGFKLPPTEKI